MLPYVDLVPPLKLEAMSMVVLDLIMNLVLDLQMSEGEKLVTGPTLFQYPPMIRHTTKGRREIPRHLTRTTLLICLKRIYNF
jgi:hypothetical protein